MSERTSVVPFSPGGRVASLRAMATRSLDVLVVGGGITGAGVARDAALRGWSVALVGQFNSPKKSEVRSLLIVGGATVHERLEGMLASCVVEKKKRSVKSTEVAKGSGYMVALSEQQPTTSTLEMCAQKNVPLVRVDWLLDSISHYLLRPIEEFAWS